MDNKVSLADFANSLQVKIGKEITNKVISICKCSPSYHDKRNRNLLSPGAVICYQRKCYILKANNGNYYNFIGEGDHRFLKSACDIVLKNRGLVIYYLFI